MSFLTVPEACRKAITAGWKVEFETLNLSLFLLFILVCDCHIRSNVLPIKADLHFLVGKERRVD